jgi:hypothetical protein
MDPINEASVSNSSSKKGLYIGIGILVLLVIGFLMRGSFYSKNLDGSTTVKNDYGTVTTNTNKLPANWPSDAPIYPNAKISQSGSVDTQIVGTEASSLVTLTTPDDIQMVNNFYKTELSNNGWTVNSALSNGALVFAIKGNRMINITSNSLKTGGVMILVTTGVIPQSLQKSLDSLSASQNRANTQNKIPQ